VCSDYAFESIAITIQASENMDEEEKPPLRKPRAKRIEKVKGFFHLHRSVTCSLSRILRRKHMDFVNELVTYTSQLRSLASIACKLHVFSVCDRDNRLWFPIDQTYFNHLFSVLQDKNCRLGKRFDAEDTQEIYENDIRRAVLRVLDKVKPAFIRCGLGKTQMHKFTGAMSIRMLSDLSKHVTYQFDRSLDIWTKNQLTALMTPAEYEDRRKHMSSYFHDWKNFSESFEFVEEYDFYKTQSSQLRVPDNDEEIPTRNIDVRPYLYSMWKMRLDSENLEISTGRAMKQISVIPQCSFQAKFLHIDTTALAFMRAFREGEKTTKASEFAKVENQRETWNYFFDMPKLEAVRKAPFGWSVSTDGVSASISVILLRPEVSNSSKKRKLNDPFISKSIRNGFHSESTILETTKGFADDVEFFSVDPGVRSIITVFGLTDDCEKFELGQRQYRHESGLNDIPGRKKNPKARKTCAKRCPLLHQKSVLTNNLDAYMSCVNLNWKNFWPLCNDGKPQKGKRRVRLRRKMKRRNFMNKTMNRLKNTLETGKNKKTVILFGRGGESGGFKNRGGGIKGPVLELKRRMAQEFPVICCSEFRTSKLCYECGKTLSHPRRYNQKSNHHDLVNGVSFCSNTDHKHSVLNRDVDAAKKIGLRFMMQLHKKDIGPWSTSVKVSDLNKASWTGMFDWASKTFPSSPRRRVRDGNAVPMDRALEGLGSVDGRPPKKGRLSEN